MVVAPWNALPNAVKDAPMVVVVVVVMVWYYIIVENCIDLH